MGLVQTIKNLPAIQETGVQSLGWDYPLEQGMATHSSILAWRIPGTSKGLESSPAPQFESISSSALSLLYGSTLISVYDLTIWTVVSKVMSLLFNMLSSIVTSLLPKNKHLLIS